VSIQYQNIGYDEKILKAIHGRVGQYGMLIRVRIIVGVEILSFHE